VPPCLRAFVPSLQRLGPSAFEAVSLPLSLVGSAYLMAVAHEPGGVPAVAWLALFPLFVCISVLAPARAALAGAFWGACLYVFAVLGVSPTNAEWGVSTFRHFDVSTFPFVAFYYRSLMVAALIIAVPAIYAGLAAWLRRAIGFSPFVLGVGWMGVELAFAPVNLNLGLLAAEQTDAGVFHWLAHALGCVFLGFFIAYVNAALVDVAAKIRLPKPRPRIVRLFNAPILHLRFEFLEFFNRLPLEPCHPRAPPCPIPCLLD